MMYRSLRIVKIDAKYCNYLRKYDNKVVYIVGVKELRPFIGILFTVNKCEYFAPLSSPKLKHIKMRNTLDLIKIKDGEYGVVNLNNMIPVSKNNYREFDLNNKKNNELELHRIELLTNQLRWLNINKKKIYTKSKILYDLYVSNKLPKNVKDRCCNYPLLEDKCNIYNNNIKELNFINLS